MRCRDVSLSPPSTRTRAETEDGGRGADDGERNTDVGGGDGVAGAWADTRGRRALHGAPRISLRFPLPFLPLGFVFRGVLGDPGDGLSSFAFVLDLRRAGAVEVKLLSGCIWRYVYAYPSCPCVFLRCVPLEIGDLLYTRCDTLPLFVLLSVNRMSCTTLRSRLLLCL